MAATSQDEILKAIQSLVVMVSALDSKVSAMDSKVSAMDSKVSSFIAKQACHVCLVVDCSSLNNSADGHDFCRNAT